MKFEELDICEALQKGIADLGYEEATPIQAQAIPVALQGKDLVGQAQTGTGKTAAFGIPVLQKIDTHIRRVQSIILCPTRELAIQVAEEIRDLAKYMRDIRILPVYGGQDIVKQIRSLKGGVHIIIGTPGRVMDHMDRGTLKLDEINTVVLDEADEMLNMGFREDIESILSDTPKERQTLLFSATMPAPILYLARTYQDDAQMIKVVKKELTVTNIEQYYMEVRRNNKDEILSRVLDMYNPNLSIIFCNTKRKVDELTTELQGRGYFAEGLHGDMKQQSRDRVMEAFRSGKCEILIATDVAARGIDVDNVDIVFNYDLPQDDEYYVHRIGRTARAGKTGMAFSFVRGKEVYKLRDIERYAKTKISLRKPPSLDDVTATRTDALFERISKIIENENLESTISSLETRLEEEDFTAMDVAAAFIKMQLMAKEGGEDANSFSGDSYHSDSRDYEYNDRGRGGRRRDRDDDYSGRGSRDRFEKRGSSSEYYGDTGASEPGMVRLFINIGKKQRVSPGNIVGAIAGESNISGRQIGAINMYENFSFVEVNEAVVKDVLDGMGRDVMIKGYPVNVETAKRTR